MQYVVNRNDAEPGMATADEVERALQKAVANGLPPLKRLYHKGKAEPMAADAEPDTPEQKAILYSTFLQYANFGQNRSRQVRELDSFRFAKLVREACDANSSPEPLALSPKQQQEIDLLFTALLVKAGAARTLNYHAFEALAVPAIAEAAASTEDAVRFSLSCAVPALRSSVPVSPRARLRSAGSSGSLSSPVRPASAGVVRSPMLSLAFGSDAPSPKPKAQVSPESSPRRVSMEDLQKRGAFASPPRSVVGAGAPEPTAEAVNDAASAALAAEAEAAPTATAPPDERLRLLFDAYAAFGRDRRRISSRRGRITRRRGAAFEHAAERALGLVEGAAPQQGRGAGVRGRVVVAPLGRVVVGVTPLADAQRATVEFNSCLPRPIVRDRRAVVRREVDFASALLPFGPRFDEFREWRSGPALWYRELERCCPVV